MSLSALRRPSSSLVSTMYIHVPSALIFLLSLWLNGLGRRSLLVSALACLFVHVSAADTTINHFWGVLPAVVAAGPSLTALSLQALATSAVRFTNYITGKELVGADGTHLDAANRETVDGWVIPTLRPIVDHITEIEALNDSTVSEKDFLAGMTGTSSRADGQTNWDKVAKLHLLKNYAKALGFTRTLTGQLEECRLRMSSLETDAETLSLLLRKMDIKRGVLGTDQLYDAIKSHFEDPKDKEIALALKSWHDTEHEFQKALTTISRLFKAPTHIPVGDTVEGISNAILDLYTRLSSALSDVGSAGGLADAIANGIKNGLPSGLGAGKVSEGLSKIFEKCVAACPDMYSGDCGKYFSWKKQALRALSSETAPASVSLAVSVLLGITCGDFNEWLETRRASLEVELDTELHKHNNAGKGKVASAPMTVRDLVERGFEWIEAELDLDSADLMDAYLSAWNCLVIKATCWMEFQILMETTAENAGINLLAVRGTKDFARKIRKALPDWLQKELERVALGRNEDIADLDYEVIRNTASRLWKSRTVATPHTKSCGTKKADGSCPKGLGDACKCKPHPSASPAPASSRRSPAAAPAPSGSVSRNKCGVTKRYDDAPAVPESLRGPVFRWAGKGREPFSAAQTAENEARNGRCRSAAVCLSCRRPASEHGPGNSFTPVPAFASLAAGAAASQGEGQQ